MDSSFFNKVERTVTSADLKAASSNEIVFLSQTDRAKIIEPTGVTHMYTLNNARLRNGAFSTTYFSGRLIDMLTGKVIIVDEAED